MDKVTLERQRTSRRGGGGGVGGVCGEGAQVSAVRGGGATSEGSVDLNPLAGCCGVSAPQVKPWNAMMDAANTPPSGLRVLAC